MTSSKSSIVFQKIGRFLAFFTCAIIGAAVLLIIFFQIGQWHLRRIDLREKAELTLVFSRAIADGTVVDPPARQDAFVVTSRHGSNPYNVWFTNSANERVGFFVSKDCSPPGTWTFKDLTRRQSDFYRSRITNE
jgi:hypothetical protein